METKYLMDMDMVNWDSRFDFYWRFRELRF